MIQHLFALAAFHLGNIVPNPSPVAPTGNAASSVSNLIGYAKWGALIACGGTAVVSGGMLAVGNLSQRPEMAERGKKALIFAMIGAVVVAAGIPFVNQVFNTNM